MLEQASVFLVSPDASENRFPEEGPATGSGAAEEVDSDDWVVGEVDPPERAADASEIRFSEEVPATGSGAAEEVDSDD